MISETNKHNYHNLSHELLSFRQKRALLRLLKRLKLEHPQTEIAATPDDVWPHD